jgi:hypothetical protein
VSRPIPSRINPDSRPVLFVAVAVTSILAAVSFLLSYSGLVAVAAWAAVPEWLSWAVPVTIDGAILVYTLAVLVFRSRGESATLSYAVLVGWTFVSVSANALHAWLASTGDARGVAGAVIAGLAPVAVLLASHTLAALIVERPSLEEPLEEPVPAPEPVLALVPASVPAASSVPAPIVVPVDPERDERIQALSTEGRSVRAIAEEVGVSKSTVSRILSRVSRLA